MNTAYFRRRSKESRRRAFGLVPLLTAAAFLSAAPGARAQLTIIRNFIGLGSTFVGGFPGGTAPGNVGGGGDLPSIFNVAADYWEAAILDPWTVTIHFGWAPLNNMLGAHQLRAQVPVAGVPSRETVGNIFFDNDGTSIWFADPTPSRNEEYSTYTESAANLGGGVINTGRVYSGATGVAVGRPDLLSVALHEIGHALGLASTLTSFLMESGDLDVDVIAPRPFAGTQIPLTPGTPTHINLANTLMFSPRPFGTRTLPSAADILANAEVSNFNNLNLNPQLNTAIPEPGTFALFGSGLLGLVGFVTRRRVIQ